MWNLPCQGSNLCPLHWQADSYLLHHQISPFSPGFESRAGYLSLGTRDVLDAITLLLLGDSAVPFRIFSNISGPLSVAPHTHYDNQKMSSDITKTVQGWMWGLGCQITLD